MHQPPIVGDRHQFVKQRALAGRLCGRWNCGGSRGNKISKEGLDPRTYCGQRAPVNRQHRHLTVRGKRLPGQELCQCRQPYRWCDQLIVGQRKFACAGGHARLRPRAPVNAQRWQALVTAIGSQPIHKRVGRRIVALAAIAQ